MTSDELDVLWKDPAHWTRWSYYCKEDPRVIVPKRNPLMGWTVNAGHPKAFFALMGLAVIAACVPVLVTIMELPYANSFHLFLALLTSFVITVVLCMVLSRNPKR